MTSDADALGDEFYADLRPSEATRLHEPVTEAAGLADGDARAVIVQAVVGAALTFGAEHTDAPRARKSEPVGV